MKSHDAAVITMLREDPDMGVDYLRTALMSWMRKAGNRLFLWRFAMWWKPQGGMAIVAKRASQYFGTD